VDIHFLLEVVRQEIFRRVEAEQTLSPTKRFACYEEAEKCHQPIEDAAMPNRVAKSDQSCREEQPHCPPFDDAILLHEHVVTIWREVPQEQHAQDPCSSHDVE